MSRSSRFKHRLKTETRGSEVDLGSSDDLSSDKVGIEDVVIVDNDGQEFELSVKGVWIKTINAVVADVVSSSYTKTEIDAAVANATMAPSDILSSIISVGGAGSGLNADLLDGHSGTYYAPQATTYTKTQTDSAISGLVAAAPATLNTLNELAAALGDDPSFATTITNSIGTKAPKASPTLTGTITLDKLDELGSVSIRALRPLGIPYNTVTTSGRLDIGGDLYVNGTITANSTVDAAVVYPMFVHGNHNNNKEVYLGIDSPGTSSALAVAFGVDRTGTKSAKTIIKTKATDNETYITERDLYFRWDVAGVATDNRVWHTGNDSVLFPYQSHSDFVNGTLVTTSIPSSATNGASFIIEVTGKSYSSSDAPHSVIAQGYLYNNTIINYSGSNMSGSSFTQMKAMNNDGYLSFWWPRHGYWNSYSVQVREVSVAGTTKNTVTSIVNSPEPVGSKKVTIDLVSAGTVLQVVTVANSTVTVSSPPGTSVGLWAFSIPNVKAGSSIFGSLNISTLNEHAGSKNFWVENASGAVLGSAKVKGVGLGGWNMPLPTLQFKDTSPSVGTNTYTLKVTHNVTVYMNYPTDYGNGVSSVTLTEIKQ